MGQNYCAHCVCGRGGQMSDELRKNNRKTVAVYAVFFVSLSLLLALGGWQCRRGFEKAAIEKLLAHTPNQILTIDRAPQNWHDLAYRRVRLQGDWLTHATFLLANRVHRGQVGYEAFSAFRLAGDASVMLVNRGWVGRDLRHENSAIDGFQKDLNTGQQNPASIHDQLRGQLRGQLYVPQAGFTLGAAYRAQEGWPKVIQYWDAAQMEAPLGTALQPAALALDSDHPAAFTSIWRATTMTSSRHFAYAAQWWGLALTLIVFGFIWRRQATRSAGARVS